MVRTSTRGQSRPGPGRERAPRGPRAEQRGIERRRAILRAAAGAFRERGYQATGMREIAARAGLSPGNLYYYFAGKDELLYFCQDRALERMLEAVEAAERSEAAPDAKLRQVMAAQVHCMLDELDGAAAHTELDALPPALRERLVAKRDRYERAVRAIVAEGMRSGAFRCDPARRDAEAVLVTRAILGALNGTARWYRPDGALAPGEVAATYSDYLVRGLLP